MGSAVAKVLPNGIWKLTVTEGIQEVNGLEKKKKKSIVAPLSLERRKWSSLQIDAFCGVENHFVLIQLVEYTSSPLNISVLRKEEKRTPRTMFENVKLSIK